MLLLLLLHRHSLFHRDALRFALSFNFIFLLRFLQQRYVVVQVLASEVLERLVFGLDGFEGCQFVLVVVDR